MASNGQNIRGFRGWEHGTTNILATNDYLRTFTWSASSNHEYKNHELINIAEPRIVWTTKINRYALGYKLQHYNILLCKDRYTHEDLRKTYYSYRWISLVT